MPGIICGLYAHARNAARSPSFVDIKDTCQKWLQAFTDKLIIDLLSK